jgi:DNA replication protein DnaC
MRDPVSFLQAGQILASFDAPRLNASPEDIERIEREREDISRKSRALDRRRAAVERIPLPAEDIERLIADTVDVTPAMRAVKRWLDVSPTAWLVLSGGTGTGKTVAAAYAAAELGGVYVTAKQLRPLVIKAMWSNEKHPAPPLAHAMMTSKLLIIDDLGTEDDDAEKFGSALFEVLNRRLALRTIITTNLSPSDLLDPKRYGERVVDRIRHLTTTSDGKSAALELGGKSLRRGAA